MEAVADSSHEAFEADTEVTEFELRITYDIHRADRKSLKQCVELSVFMIVYAPSGLLFRLISLRPFRSELSSWRALPTNRPPRIFPKSGPIDKFSHSLPFSLADGYPSPLNFTRDTFSNVITRRLRSPFPFRARRDPSGLRPRIVIIWRHAAARDRIFM